MEETVYATGVHHFGTEEEQQVIADLEAKLEMKKKTAV